MRRRQEAGPPPLGDNSGFAMATGKRKNPGTKPASSANSVCSASSEIEGLRERLNNLKECFRVSSMLNSSLELEDVLENIMTTSRAILKAEACSLMLVDEKSDELVFEVAQGPVAQRLEGGFRVRKGQGISGHVFATGKSILLKDAYSDPRFCKDIDQLTGYHTSSILCVPLKIKERVIGVAQVINKLDGAPFTTDDEENLNLLSVNAALAVENARLHGEILRKRQLERDLAFASTIQLSFLPSGMPAFHGFRFGAHYKAAQEVGGDFYDFIPLDDKTVGVLIGDVSGKGIASALFMAKLTSDFRLLAIREKNPEKLIAAINNRVFEQSRRGMFVTLLYMVLSKEKNEAVFVNGGHLPPIVWNRRAGKFSLVRSSGPPLGILPDQEFQAAGIALDPGGCILLATDGLTEARNARGELFGWDRLKEAVRSGDSDIDSVKSRVIGSIEDFVSGQPQADDTTMVLVGVEER